MDKLGFGISLIRYFGLGDLDDETGVVSLNAGRNTFTPVENDSIVEVVIRGLIHHNLRSEFFAAQTYLSRAVAPETVLTERMIMFVAFGPYDSITLHNEALVKASPNVAEAVILTALKNREVG